VAKAEGALFFAPFAASDALRDAAHPNVFHVRPSMADEAFKMVRHSATLGQSRIAVLAEDDPMGRAGPGPPSTWPSASSSCPRWWPPRWCQSTVTRSMPLSRRWSRHSRRPSSWCHCFNTTAAFIRKARKAGYGGRFMCFSVVGIDPLFTALGNEIGGVVVSQVVPLAAQYVDTYRQGISGGP
jgi:branched-chain amino acid transport system substrate-binding protein